MKVGLSDVAVPTHAFKSKKTLENRAAKEEAERRWVADYVDKMVAAETHKWKEAGELRKTEIARRKEETTKEAQAKAKLEERRQRELKLEMGKQRAEKRLELQKSLAIPHFDKAKPIAAFCEHLRSKAWGSAYGKGLRCLDCGKELTQTHDELSQQRGIGAGDDPYLVANVERHRRNEAAYRFSAPGEVAQVEAERVRLEKEGRLLANADMHFYDFEDMKRVYEFDRRHKIFFKEQNLVRQGIQWTEVELDERKASLLADSEELSPRSRKLAKGRVDSHFNNALPTARKVELVHRAHFRDVILTFGRINNFRTRLRELAAQVCVRLCLDFCV